MAMPIPTHKVCGVHGEVTEEKRYYYATRTGKTSFRCKPCMANKGKEFRQLNPEYNKTPEQRAKHKVSNRKWVANNRDKIREKNRRHYPKQKEYYQAVKHTERYKVACRARGKRQRYKDLELSKEKERIKAKRHADELSGCYLNKILSLRGMKDIPDKEIMRQLIKTLLTLKRAVRERK